MEPLRRVPSTDGETLAFELGGPGLSPREQVSLCWALLDRLGSGVTVEASDARDPVSAPIRASSMGDVGAVAAFTAVMGDPDVQGACHISGRTVWAAVDPSMAYVSVPRGCRVDAGAALAGALADL